MRCASTLRLSALVSFVVAVGACSDSDGSEASPPAPSPSSTTEPTPGSSPPSETPAQPAACPRVAKADDRTRKVVVSHPFGEDGSKANLYEVLELSSEGALTRTNETFEMARGLSEIAFTPDGEVGLVAQEDGSVGVFTFDAAGKVRVVHAAFTGQFYPSHVVVSRDGARAFLIDPQTANNGGGVHEVRIGCDGSLTYVGLTVPGGQAHAMALLPTNPDRAVLVAGAAFDSASGDYAHTLDLSMATPKRLASGPVFGDSDAIASWVAVTPDGKWALVTDNGFAMGSRMAPVALDTMKPAPTMTVANPAAVVMSPFGNAALLLESDGEDALRALTYDPAKTDAPFTLGPEVAYKDGKKTELPLIAFAIDRGSLKGRVLVAENQAVRQLVFAPDGAITDLGTTTFEGFTGIVGSLGVQP